MIFRHGISLVLCLIILDTVPRRSFAERPGESKPTATEPPVIPIGLDAYRSWDRWPYQRIGCRAYMRSTYDRAGGNETADASHFLYQEDEQFNVSLDVEGKGVLYFVRTNHWHGSPWHYEVDGRDHIVQETTTADPTVKLDHSVFLPEHLFPNPLTWTYSITKGADLMWVPIPFEERFRLAYSRTFYGTGYYIYHLYDNSALLSQPIEAWDGTKPPDQDVLDLLNAAGTDIAPKHTTPQGRALEVQRISGSFKNQGERSGGSFGIKAGPTMIRALSLSVPREHAVAFGRGRIQITWDGREHPSVDAPIDLFFGAGTLHNRDNKEYLVKALPVNVRFDDERAYLACYFPMPFFRSAHFQITAPADASFDVRWSLRKHPYRDPANHVGYFHATYRDHPDPVLGQDNVFLDTREAEGGGDWSGSFVGTSFIFSDRAVLNTLEGDPRFFFDDSQTPQAYGTGTEEWGGGGDYWGGRNMTLPLAGHPVGVRRVEDAKCPEDLIQSAYRFLLADLMPFGKRAVIRLEHGGTNQSLEHYQSVTYWYGLPRPSLVLTDELDVGDADSEMAHAYVSPNASDPYELTSRYEWGIDHVRERPATDTSVRETPSDYVEFDFEADADKKYFIWVRGRTRGGIVTDATWFQFDKQIGTNQLGSTYNSPKGFGNWRDSAAANTWSWSSSLPQSPPQTVTFRESGKHRLQVQRRHGPHQIDQIWLSAAQMTRPESADPVSKPTGTNARDEIVLDATDATEVRGQVKITAEKTASVGEALWIGIANEQAASTHEVYPAHTQIGRTTTTQSEFTLKLRPDNQGVVLRRTLDYQYPHQRANIYLANTDGDDPPWRPAGVWYLAGSNTCYHSYPREAGELGKTNPVVQTSNRRFRDDEFIVPRELTAGRSAIRVRVEFTPVKIPLLPGRPVGELAWSEIRYQAYCFVMPDFEGPE